MDTWLKFPAWYSFHAVTENGNCLIWVINFCNPRLFPYWNSPGSQDLPLLASVLRFLTFKGNWISKKHQHPLKVRTMHSFGGSERKYVWCFLRTLPLAKCWHRKKILKTLEIFPCHLLRHPWDNRMSLFFRWLVGKLCLALLTVGGWNGQLGFPWGISLLREEVKQVHNLCLRNTFIPMLTIYTLSTVSLPQL